MRWWVTDSGLRKRTALSFSTEQDATVFARIVETVGGDEGRAAIAIAAVKRGDVNVSDAVLSHVEKLVSASDQQKTRYRKQVAHHLSGQFGMMPVASVTGDDVLAWIARMQAKGLSAKKIRNVHGPLSSAMKSQIRLGVIGVNPCAGVKLPKSETAGDTMHFLSREEFGLLLAAIPDHYKLLVETMVATGLRWGEIAALTVAYCCNLSAHPPTIRVNKARKRDGENRHYVGSTKSARGRRTVAVPTSLALRLKESLRGRGQGSHVFVNRLGGEIRHNRFWWKTWRPALEKAQNPTAPDGSPDLDAPRLMKAPRIHDLRHTRASWMIAQGTDLMVLQRRLGHESITTTVDRYSHLLPQQHIDAATAAERALYGGEGEPS